MHFASLMDLVACGKLPKDFKKLVNCKSEEERENTLKKLKEAYEKKIKESKDYIDTDEEETTDNSPEQEEIIEQEKEDDIIKESEINTTAGTTDDDNENNLPDNTIHEIVIGEDNKLSDYDKLLEGMDTSGDVYIHIKKREVFDMLNEAMKRDQKGELDAYLIEIRGKQKENINTHFKKDVYDTFIELCDEILAYEPK